MTRSNVGVVPKDCFRVRWSRRGQEEKGIRTTPRPNISTFDKTLTRTLASTYRKNLQGKFKARILFVTQVTGLHDS